MDEHNDPEHSPDNPSPDSSPADGTTPDQPGDGDTNGDNKIAPEFELVTIEWRDARFEVPKDRGQWDMNVQFEFEEGRRLRGLLTLLGNGPDGVSWARAKVYAFARTNREVDEFMDHCTAILNKECIG